MSVGWHKYYLEPVRRLPYEGREFLGKFVSVTEKRDGSNMSVWPKQSDGNDITFRISSHNLIVAEDDLQNKLIETVDYSRLLGMLTNELKQYGNEYVAYGELIYGNNSMTPTRLEPKHKNTHYFLFDLWDVKEQRYIPYVRLYQYAFQWKIPIVKEIFTFTPMKMEEIDEAVKRGLSWCTAHRREGIVLKSYENQAFAKERRDIPKRERILKNVESRPVYPPMPQDRIIRGLTHAFDEIGEANWKNVKIAMPAVAAHLATEAREHLYEPPHEMYKLYLNTSIEQLRGKTDSETKQS